MSKPLRPIDSLYVVEDRGYLSSCWIWCGSTDVNKKYGYYRGKRAHRYIYERLKGRIPVGMQLDHLCRVKSCVNPEHLEIVTPKENTRRYLEYLNERNKQRRSAKS